MLLFLVPVHLLVGFVDDGVEVAEGGEAEDVADGSAAVMDAHVHRCCRA